MSKKIKTRIKQKHETETNWEKSSFVPYSGEVVIYDPDALHNYSRVKVGDGINNVNNLPFVNDGIGEKIRRANDLGTATLNDDETASSDILWSSSKTRGFIEQVVSSTVGNYIGVSFTLTNGKYVGKRIGPYSGYKPGEDFNNFNMYGNRKLVGVDLSDDNFTIKGIYETLADATAAFASDPTLDFFVQQPKFYYKITGNNTDFNIYIADTKIEDDYKVHPAFYRNGVEKDCIYIGKDCVAGTGTNLSGNNYNGINITSISKANTNRITGGWRALSRDGCRQGVKTYNSKLSLYDIWALSASQILYMVEYADLEVQSALAEGETKIPHPNTGDYFNTTMLSLNSPMGQKSGNFIELTDVAYANFSFSTKNLWRPDHWKTPRTANGITVQYLEDEDCFVFNGTSTGWIDIRDETFWLPNMNGKSVTISTKYISGELTGGNISTYVGKADSPTSARINFVSCLTNMTDHTATGINDKEGLKYIWFVTGSDTVVTNYKVKVQLEITDTATAYTPYISDFSNVKVQKTQNGQITILDSLTDNNVTGTATYQANTLGALISAIYPSSDNQGLKIFNNYGTYAYYIDYLTGAGSLDSANSRCVEMSYRWENNLWGGPYKLFVDGMNIKWDVSKSEYIPYISQHPSEYEDDKINGNYKRLSSFGWNAFKSQGGFPKQFHEDLLRNGLFYGVSYSLSDTNTAGLPDYTAFYASTVHCAVPCIGCVYNWETPGGIMGGPGLFQYELVNQNSSSTSTSAYNNYTTAKAIYIP